mgnify:CR=1 FL=1
MRALLGSAADLVLPRTCGGCCTVGAGLCVRCERLLSGEARPVVPRPVPDGWPPCWAGGSYEGAAAAALRAFKDGDRRDLAPWLARCLAVAVDSALVGEPAAARAATTGRLAVVPVPSARRTTRRRGDRPVVQIAQAALAGLHQNEAPIVEALSLSRGVVDQAGLDAVARRANLAAAMQVHPAGLRRVRGSVCLVVDDVVTSGSTVAEASRALQAAGAAGVVAAAALATPRRSGLVNPLPGGRPSD